MSIGKRLLAFSPQDGSAAALTHATDDWGCIVTVCHDADQLRGRVEGSEFDLVLVEGSACLREMIAESDPDGEVLRLPLAEIEKRHVLRVLASTGGNKTRAAKVLGIDTKTLYNKLKLYESGRLSGGARDLSGGAEESNRSSTPSR